MKTPVKHKFKFVNYSGTYQVHISEPDDVRAVLLLADPLWISTSVPTKQLRCDPAFLQILDQDNDGRILSDDLRDIVKWFTECMSSLDDLSAQSESLTLDNINETSEAGKKLLVTARRILKNTGQPDAKSISLPQIRNEKAFRSGDFYSGDGIITPREASDQNVKDFLADVLSVMPPVKDVNGDNGVDTPTLNSFLEYSEQLLAWMENAQDGKSATLFPLAEETAACYTLIEQIRPAVEKFFHLSALRAVNQMMDTPHPAPECPPALLNEEEHLKTFILETPIARPNPDGRLDLDAQINPAYAESLKTLNKKAFTPLLGNRDDCRKLTESDWNLINATFDPYRKWLKAKPGGNVEKLGPEKLRKYVSGDMPTKLRELIANDLEMGKELSAVKDLEKVVLINRWLMEFCNNFVNFHNLYSPATNAMFEAGHLVIAGREFRLCMKVADPAAHSVIAEKSGIFLMYLEVTGAKPEETFNIVTPVTSENARGLSKDRRGVFFDLNGKEWDARVIRVVENPVSLKQAVLQPFIRIGAVISGSFEKMVGGAEKQIETGITKEFGKVETDIKTGIAEPVPAQAPQVPQKSGTGREWLLSGSIALAALGSSFAFITKTLANLHLTTVLSAVGVGLAIILVPVILIADFKLSRRNLGAILEASGWAINADMRLSRKLAKLLSPTPKKPAGFDKIRRDIVRKLRKEQ